MSKLSKVVHSKYIKWGLFLSIIFIGTISTYATTTDQKATGLYKLSLSTNKELESDSSTQLNIKDSPSKESGAIEKQSQKDNLSKPNTIDTKATNSKSKKTHNNSKKQQLKFDISYYCSCEVCSGEYSGTTASGSKPVEGLTIAAPKEIPFGTKININGIGTYTVQDRGGHIITTVNDKNEPVMRLDIFLNNHDECYERGRHAGTGFILN